MNIYVDELPKSCKECPMCRSGKLKLQKKGRYVEAEQCVFGQYKYQTIDDEIDTCPLKLLANYNKQVRKEFVQKIKENVKKETDFGYIDEKVSLYMLFKILDQIQGETNENNN